MIVVSPNTDNHPVADSGIKKNSKFKHDTYLSLLNTVLEKKVELNTETSSSHRIFSQFSVQRRRFGESSQVSVVRMKSCEDVFIIICLHCCFFSFLCKNSDEQLH